jgi:hypothetical protein
MNMTQDAPANATPAPIDWNKIGSPSCDTGAQTEALRAMGLDANGRPINGSAPDFSQIVTQIPQLLARDVNGNAAWSPQLDIATINTTNGRERITAPAPDGRINMTELEAAVIAAAQVARRHGIAIKDVPIQDIVEEMCRPLNQIMGNSPAQCTIEPAPRR